MNELAPVVHVVDDDDAVRTAISRLLAGRRLRRARLRLGGRNAARSSAGRARLHHPRLPLARAERTELQEALGRRDDHLPVIFLTGHGDIPTPCAP